MLGDLPSTTKKHKPTEEMFEEIKGGCTDKAYLAEKYGATYGRIYKAVAHTMDILHKPEPYKRTKKPANTIWFGKAGHGKTHAAEQEAIDGELSMYKIPIAQLKKGWFNGYKGEEVILFDDFRGSSMEPQEFLNLLDGLRQLPIKGDYVENKSHTLFFTSPDHPINWWPKWYAKTDNNWAQVKRRLGTIFLAQDQKSIEIDIEDSNIYKNEIETIVIGK